MRFDAGLDLALLQNVCHRHPLVVPRQRAAFQAREGEQILHQMVHALRLLAHEVQVALALLGWQLQGLQGFDKTDQHRQRSANFVRDVGHKFAAHGLGLLQCGDILGQQQMLAFAVRKNTHR